MKPRRGEDAGRGQAAEAVRPDAGSATVWVMTGAWVLLVVVAALVVAAGGLGARQRARTAADLAALAAASSSLDARRACASAQVVAAGNGAVLVSCAVSGGTSDVVTEVRMPGVLAAFPPARGHARAGH
jgi:secretion/DNA translocation related TadE-like protein